MATLDFMTLTRRDGVCLNQDGKGNDWGQIEGVDESVVCVLCGFIGTTEDESKTKKRR